MDLYQLLTSKCHKDQEYPYNSQDAQTDPELRHREISHPLSNISEVLGSGDYRQPDLVISYTESTCLKAKKQLGLIHRHYHQAPRVARERLYKPTVLPHLDYCACVWDQSTRRNWTLYRLLPQVVLQNWTAPWQQRLSIVKWPCLEDRRKVQKLIMCHKIINGRSCIPSSIFSQHPYPSQRHSHRFLFYFVCTTDSFSFSSIFLF